MNWRRRSEEALEERVRGRLIGEGQRKTVQKQTILMIVQGLLSGNMILAAL